MSKYSKESIKTFLLANNIGKITMVRDDGSTRYLSVTLHESYIKDKEPPSPDFIDPTNESFMYAWDFLTNRWQRFNWTFVDNMELYEPQ